MYSYIYTNVLTASGVSEASAVSEGSRLSAAHVAGSQIRENSMNPLGWPRSGLGGWREFRETQRPASLARKYGVFSCQPCARNHCSGTLSRPLCARNQRSRVLSRPLCARNHCSAMLPRQLCARNHCSGSLRSHSALETTARACAVATVYTKPLLELAP